MSDCKGASASNCKSCSAASNCGDKVIEIKKPLPSTKIGKIIGVLSGKGGVGKSMVSSLIAVSLANKGYKVGILDGDITGPSIGKMFGLENREIYGDETGIVPILSSVLNIKIVSMNMFLESDENPCLLRGPIVGNFVKQFYTDVYWQELDYLIIDMPPGTSDVSLSVIQEIPIDEIVMVTSPSKLVSMIVAKAINMARMTGIRISGLVENMSYIKCEHCHQNTRLYDEKITLELSNRYQVQILDHIPLDPNLSLLCDKGEIEKANVDYLDNTVKNILL